MKKLVWKSFMEGHVVDTNILIEHENAVIDMYGKPNPAWDQAAVEEEIKSAIKSSLSKKVASLQEDRWMFERSKEQR